MLKEHANPGSFINPEEFNLGEFRPIKSIVVQLSHERPHCLVHFVFPTQST